MVLCYRSFHGTNFGTQRVLLVLWYFAIAHTNAKNSAQALCFLFVVLCYRSFHSTNFGTQRVLGFLYPFQRLRKRKLNGYGFVVFRCRSYQCKKLGTIIVPFYKQKQTFLRCKVCSMFVVLRYRSFHGTNFGTQSVLVL